MISSFAPEAMPLPGATPRMASTSTPPSADVPKHVQDILDHPWLGSLPVPAAVDGSTIADNLRRTAFVEIQGDGPFRSRTFVPRGDAARALLSGADGARVERILRGGLSVLDGLEGVSELSGLALGMAPGAFTANYIAGLIADGYGDMPPDEPDEQVVNELYELMQGSMVMDLGGAASSTRWMNINDHDSILSLALTPDRLTPDEAARRGTLLAFGFAHELLHRVTPPAPDEVNGWGGYQLWEEVGNDLLGLALTERTARAMGVPCDSAHLAKLDQSRNLGYGSPLRESLRRLLRVADIDVATTDGFRRGFDVFQGGPVAAAPERFVRATMERRELPDDWQPEPGRDWTYAVQRLRDAGDDPASTIEWFERTVEAALTSASDATDA